MSEAYETAVRRFADKVATTVQRYPDTLALPLRPTDEIRFETDGPYTGCDTCGDITADLELVVVRDQHRHVLGSWPFYQLPKLLEELLS